MLPKSGRDNAYMSMSEKDEARETVEGPFYRRDFVRIIFQNLQLPGLLNVAYALETVFNQLDQMVTPVNFTANHTLKYNMDRYRERISETSEYELAKVPSEIGIPVLERLSSTQDPYLSQFWINFLTNASLRAFSNLAHPSFIQLISSLSSDEAKIINHIRTEDQIPFINFKATLITDHTEHDYIKKYLTGLEFELVLNYPQNSDLYFENFIRLGLFVINKSHEIVEDDMRFKALSQRYDTLKTLLASKLDDNKYSDLNPPEKWFFEKTNYGEYFMKACTRKSGLSAG